MSTPISQCLAFKAAVGDEESIKQLVNVMRYNFQCGHYSILACNCQPPCERPTEEQLIALQAYINTKCKNV